MKMPSAATIAKRFVKYAPQRSDRFEEGVRNPSKDWAKETLAAEGNYEEGIKRAMQRKAFGKGVTKAGTAKQQTKSITKGIPRWSGGIAEAGPDMEAAMTPVVAVFGKVKITPKNAQREPRKN